MSTTTTNPLILTGDELEDARTVALWGVDELAWLWRDCTRPDGEPMGGRDLAAELATAAYLTAVLMEPGHPVVPWIPLTRALVDCLEYHAREVQERAQFAVSERCETAEMVAWTASRAEVANRVMVTIERLQRHLPQEVPA